MTNSFNGTGVALVTPFHNDKTIDFEGLTRVTEHVIEGGVDYIVVMGTTGESATLAKEEKKQVTDIIISIVNKRIPIVLGMGGNDTMHVTETIKKYNFSGISGILSVAPYYNKPTQKGLYEHFAAIAKASPLPVILYNVPGRTASNINAETVVSLAKKYPQIKGIKEASGNFTQIMQILRDKPQGFEVISGDDALTLPIIHLGGKGVISVIANSHPAYFSAIVKQALVHDYEKANPMHYRLLDLIAALFEEGSPAGVKACLEIMGVCKSMVRLPLIPASNTLKDKLRTLMLQLG